MDWAETVDLHSIAHAKRSKDREGSDGMFRRWSVGIWMPSTPRETRSALNIGQERSKSAQCTEPTSESILQMALYDVLMVSELALDI